jgi:hypothetical protein
MQRKNVFTKILAIAGTFLVWFPILATIFISISYFPRAHRFLFDYLLPAELLPAFILGGLLLLWAAFRAQARRAILGWSFGAAVVLLFVAGGLAAVTGLASGETPPGGWQSAVVFAFIMLYILAVIITGIGGALLIIDLFKQGQVHYP